MSRVLTTCPGTVSGLGCEPIVATVSSAHWKDSQTPRSSVSASPTVPASEHERDHQRELTQAPQEGPDLGALAHQWW